jgi:hypothetical protein
MLQLIIATSYVTKIDNMVTKELKIIIVNSIEKIKSTYSYSKDEKCIFNVQQMSAQLVIYILLSIPLCHAFRIFKFA